MKILIALCLLLPLPAFSTDVDACLTKAIRISLAYRYAGRLVYKADGFLTTDSKSIEALCSDIDSRAGDHPFAYYQNQLLTSKKLILKDLSSKGKASATYLLGIFENADKDMSADEICAEVEKMKKEDMGWSDCSIDTKAYWESSMNQPLESLDARSGCEKQAPAMQKLSQECRSKRTQKGEVTREPPGEEIAPAEDEPKKVKLNKAVVDSVQPAKVDLNPKPRAGGSSQ